MSFLMRNCFSRGNWPTSSWGPHEETDFPRGPHEAFSTRNLIPHEYLMRFTVSNFFSRGNWPTFSWAAHEAFSTRNFDSLIVIVRFCMRNIFDGENDLATFLWGLQRGPHEAFSTRKFPLKFPQWASCPHPNLSFIPRETLMNTFLSHESFHEEQTEQQMRDLHHKYMYGWNKKKKKTRKKEQEK